MRPNLPFRRAEVEGDVQDWLMTTLKLDGLGARTSDFSLLHDPRTALQNGRHRLCPPAAHPNKLFESKQLADATKGSAASAMGCRSAAAHKSPRCTPAPASKACLGSIMESNGARGELEISCAEEASGRTQANRREQIGLAAPTFTLLGESARGLAEAMLDDWGADVLRLQEVSNGHALCVLGKVWHISDTHHSSSLLPSPWACEDRSPEPFKSLHPLSTFLARPDSPVLCN